MARVGLTGRKMVGFKEKILSFLRCEDGEKYNQIFAYYFTCFSMISIYFSLEIPKVFKFVIMTVLDNSLCAGTTIDLERSPLL